MRRYRAGTSRWLRVELNASLGLCRSRKKVHEGGDEGEVDVVGLAGGAEKRSRIP